METLSPVEMYIANLRAGSHRTMRAALQLLARKLSAGELGAEVYPWHQLRYPQLVQLRSWLEETYAPATANKILSALRGVLIGCADLDLITNEQLLKLIKIKSIEASHLVKGRMLTLGEQGRLMNACGPDPAGQRDAAILVVMLRAGLRRSEVVALDLGHWRNAERMLLVKGGKGDKDREVPLPRSAVPILKRWLRLRGLLPGPIFPGVNKSGRIGARRMTDQAILVILRRLATRAQVDDFSPHDLRRTYISSLFQAGVDVAQIQRLAGHADPKTSASYDRRGNDELRAAADRLPDLGDLVDERELYGEHGILESDD